MALAAAPDLERLVRREHANPHDVLGAHPPNSGVVIRAFRPAARPSGRHRQRRAVELEQVHPGGVFEAIAAEAELPLRYKLEVAYGERAPSRSTTRTASCRRSASSTSTSPARAATRSSTTKLGAHVHEIDGVAGHGVRRVGAGRARRCQWSATSTPGTAGCTRCARSARPASGSCSCPASGDGAHYKYEILAPDGRDPAEGRSRRLRRRGPAQDRLGRPRARPTSGPTTSG